MKDAVVKWGLGAEACGWVRANGHGKGDSYPGEHDAIIDRETWDRVHAILQESPRKRAARTRADTPALLKGVLFGPDGAAFSPTHTRIWQRFFSVAFSWAPLRIGNLG